jgi:ADP-ribosylglycohydrolase
MMDSIRRSGAYDLKDIKKAHIEAFNGKWGQPIGWGKTTRTICEKIKNNVNYTVSINGGGNGTVIKISPLAIYAVYRTLNTHVGKFTNSFNASLLKKCREISMITHGHPMCIVATYCQARMIIRALQNELPTQSLEIAQLFIEDAQNVETKIVTNDVPLLSKKLQEFLTQNNFDKETTIVSTLICTSASSFILNSYPLVTYCVSKYLPYRNFQYAITQTINAGADADSNGSMVGAIMGAYLGLHNIPKQWLSMIRNPTLLEFQYSSFITKLESI